MNRALKSFTAILVWIMTARGIDYVTGNSYDMGRIWGDRLSMPEIWGVACLLVAILATIALVWSRPRMMVNVGLLGMAVSAMFAVQIADVRMFSWPPEDIRLITDHLGHAAMWLLISATIHYRLGVEKRKTRILEEADG